MKKRIPVLTTTASAIALGTYLYITTESGLIIAGALTSALLTSAASVIHHITSDTRPGIVSSGESSVFACSAVLSAVTTGIYALAIPVHLITAPFLTSSRYKEKRSIFTGAVMIISTAAVLAIFSHVSAIDGDMLSTVISGKGTHLSWRFLIPVILIAISIFLVSMTIGRSIQYRSASLEYHSLPSRIIIVLLVHLFRASAVIPLFILAGLSAASPFPEKSRRASDIAVAFMISLTHYELFHIAVSAGLGIAFCVYTVTAGFITHIIISRTEVFRDRNIRSYFNA